MTRILFSQWPKSSWCLTDTLTFGGLRHSQCGSLQQKWGCKECLHLSLSVLLSGPTPLPQQTYPLGSRQRHRECKGEGERERERGGSAREGGRDTERERERERESSSKQQTVSSDEVECMGACVWSRFACRMKVGASSYRCPQTPIVQVTP